MKDAIASLLDVSARILFVCAVGIIAGLFLMDYVREQAKKNPPSYDVLSSETDREGFVCFFLVANKGEVEEMSCAYEGAGSWTSPKTSMPTVHW